MATICLYDFTDSDMEDIVSYESDVVPVAGSIVSVSEATEDPVAYLVVGVTHQVSGSKIRCVLVGVVPVPKS